jgi:hypothetical protein
MKEETKKDDFYISFEGNFPRVILNNLTDGHAIAQAINRRLPTAAARVRAQVRS